MNKTSVFRIAVSLLLTLAMSLCVLGQILTGTVARIGMADFAKALKAGSVVVLDVRTAEGYRAGHIPGAILMPIGEIQLRGKELPKNKLIVAYCNCSAEQTSVGAAQLLMTQGFKDVRALQGGYSQWVAEGRDVIQGDKPDKPK